MGTWNYRVVRKDGLLGIHEAYYDDGGKLHSLSIDSVSPTYEDLAELKSNLELMMEAVDDAVLDFEQHVHDDQSEGRSTLAKSDTQSTS